MNKGGFSLVEILISTSIAVLIVGLLAVIMVNITGVFYKESSKVNIGLNANDALSNIRSNIKDASGIVDSYIGGSTTFTTGTTQLVLKIPAIDSSNNIISNVFDYFVYFLDTNKLRFKTFPDPLSARKSADQIFSTSVDKLLFQYLNSAVPPAEVPPTSSSKIRITLTLKQKSGANYQTNIATSEANLRNN